MIGKTHKQCNCAGDKNAGKKWHLHIGNHFLHFFFIYTHATGKFEATRRGHPVVLLDKYSLDSNPDLQLASAVTSCHETHAYEVSNMANSWIC